MARGMRRIIALPCLLILVSFLFFWWWTIDDGPRHSIQRDDPASFSMRRRHDNWLSKSAKSLVEDADIAQVSFCPIANSVEIENFTPTHITNLSTGSPFDIYVRREGDLVSSHILNHGSWEPELVEGCIHKLETVATQKNHKKSVLLDIGANIGFFTFAAAAAGHHVVAIEMMGQNQAALMKTFCKNTALQDNVRILPFGLGAKARAVCLAYAADFNLLNGIVKCDITGSGDVKALAASLPQHYVVLGETVVVTLDELLPVIPELMDVGVVKMDTEGFEAHVMRGSRKFFEEVAPPFVMTELSAPMARRANSNPRDLLDEFDMHGYNLHVRAWNGPMLVDKPNHPMPPNGYVKSSPNQQWDGFEQFLHSLNDTLEEIFMIHQSVEPLAPVAQQERLERLERQKLMRESSGEAD